MQTTTLAPSGTFPTLCWHPGLRKWLAAWQQGTNIQFGLTSFRPVDIKGEQASYPRLYEFGGDVWLTAREGTEEGLGFLFKMQGFQAVARRALGRCHGSYPTVMGGGNVAWQRAGAQSGWPIAIASVLGADMPKPVEEMGAPTGLALIDSRGVVLNWDQLRGVVPGLSDPTFAGYLCAGATDRNKKPCVVVVDTRDGKELVLWQGQDSLNPVIAWDGGQAYAVTAWSGRGEGIRLAEFTLGELAVPVPEPKPEEPKPEEPKPPTPKPPTPKPPTNEGEDMTAEEIRRYVAALPNNVLFGAFARLHNEVLPRDRPKDEVIKNAEDGEMWTGDVTTGGANSIFCRVYFAELFIAMNAGRTPDEASGDAYDKGIAAYREAVKDPQ